MSVTALQDLRPRFGDARDQSPRATCLAFAASDAHAAVRAGGWQPLSAEWAYYHALKRDGGVVGCGTRLGAMQHALHIDGQPVEEDWPYIAREILPHDTWSPPSGVSSLYFRQSANANASFADICSELDKANPVIVVMTLSRTFDFEWDDEFVVDADEPTVPDRVHAVVAVGHGTRGTDKLILVRNSWGTSWGDSGHAWISERYLTPRLHQIAILTVEP